jgi:hypothetical protein
MTKFKWIQVPVPEPLTMQNVWEHTPLDYYRYGEYPRFINPPGAHAPPRTEWKKVPVEE